VSQVKVVIGLQNCTRALSAGALRAYSLEEVVSGAAFLAGAVRAGCAVGGTVGAGQS
jgi:hypothetical protein